MYHFEDKLFKYRNCFKFGYFKPRKHLIKFIFSEGQSWFWITSSGVLLFSIYSKKKKKNVNLSLIFL